MGEFIGQAPSDIAEHGISTTPRREVGGGCTAWYAVVDVHQLPDPVREYAKLTPSGTVQVPAKIAHEHGLYKAPKKIPDTTPYNFTVGSYETIGNGTVTSEAPITLEDTSSAELSAQTAPLSPSRPLNRHERRAEMFGAPRTDSTIQPAPETPPTRKTPFDQQKGPQDVFTKDMVKKESTKAPKEIIAVDHWKREKHPLGGRANGSKGPGRYSKRFI